MRDGKLIVDLVDGRTLIAPLEWYPRPSGRHRNSRTASHSEAFTRTMGLILIRRYAETLWDGNRSGEIGQSFERWLAQRKAHRWF